MFNVAYGVSNFENLIRKKYFYQDRTDFLPLLENVGADYIFYLRPRRFGKSLWVSTMHYYYGLEYKEMFSELFGNLYIGKNPTKQANTFMVLRFEFSRIDTSSSENTKKGFLANVLMGVSHFLTVYQTYFTTTQTKAILAETDPSEVIKLLFSYHRNNEIKSKIYLLIDEYDHFANELISFDLIRFKTHVTRNGFVRKFYESIKTATGEGVIDKLFVTGVSPITLDSLTSGFNIGHNIATDPNFNAMTAFRETDVQGILSGIGVADADLEHVSDDLRRWYNGYSFHPDALEKVYNPDMVLYFAVYYKSHKKYPNDLLNRNVASDYNKIRNVFRIGKQEAHHLATLNELNENREVTHVLTTQYSFERDFSTNDLVSLLFYTGFLTVKSSEMDAWTFTFPNYVLEKLYADYFLTMLQTQAHLPIDNTDVNKALRTLAIEGNPQPFFDQVQLILASSSVRDAQGFREVSLKMIFLTLLHQQQFYYIHSEYESERQYMDIFLEGIQPHNPKYDVVIELKYLKKAGTKALKTTFEEARTQLKNYIATKKLGNRPNLIGFVVVTVGEKVHWQAF